MAINEQKYLCAFIPKSLWGPKSGTVPTGNPHQVSSLLPWQVIPCTKHTFLDTWKKIFPVAPPLSPFALAPYAAAYWDVHPGVRAPHWPPSACDGRQWASDVVHHVTIQEQNGLSSDFAVFGSPSKEPKNKQHTAGDEQAKSSHHLGS